MTEKIKYCMAHPLEFCIAHFSWKQDEKQYEQDICIVCGNEWWMKYADVAEKWGLKITELNEGRNNEM